MSTIYTSTGKKRYVGGTILELTGKDISGATFQTGIATDAVTPPTVWGTPDVTTIGTGSITLNGVVLPATAQRILKNLIQNPYTAGTYWIWGLATDNPEIEPIPLQSFTVG